MHAVWEPNGPEAVLLVCDSGATTLSLRPREDDQDDRNVVFIWSGVRSASMGDPNDEGIASHRTYEHGLRGLLWAGEVLNDLPAVSPRHFLVLCKEGVVEVVASDVKIERIGVSTAESAAVAVHSAR